MCGLCGELRLDGAPVEAGLIGRMLPALERRGPDDGGQWADGPVAFGHRRLSIIDLSDRSHQPMVDHELCLVFNGAVYNFRELRAELKARGHAFVSGGDAEVILKAYREWGDHCPAHLDGMFAFALWDGARRRLFCARDRFGIKPLYFASDGRRFRFASNTQALLAGGGIDTAIDPLGLHFQFMLHAVIPAPHTILLSERVAREIKVVQSGQGADEVFGGYGWYPRMLAETGGSRLERFRKHYFDRHHVEWLALVTPAYHAPDHTTRYVARRLDDALCDEFMDAVLKLDVTTLVVDDPVKRVDNMTMAWGLEARLPFLDRELVELAARCPVDIKLRSGGKHLLKRCARGLVPDPVIDRPKGYFPVPALKFVRGRFLGFMHDLLDSQACRERGLFERAYVERLLAAPDMHHTRIMGSKLWHLALTESWLQRHVDGAAGLPDKG